ncbi:MAG: hypothetical protein ACRD2Z_03945 [Thermoanaerobaculia bacterium]
MRRYRYKGVAARAGDAAGILAAALALLVIPTPAWAYLDPASGSMFLQLVLGGVAGAAVALRLFWRRLAARFRPREELPSSTKDA